MQATASAAWVKTASRVNTEMAHFIGKRAVATVNFSTTLAKCNTPFDVAQAHLAFWNGFVRDWSRAAQKMTSPQADSVSMSVPVEAFKPAEIVKSANPARSAATTPQPIVEPVRDFMDLSATRRQLEHSDAA